MPKPPTVAAGLGERIDAAIRRYPSRTDAAVAAGVSLQQLRNWVSGKNDPSIVALAKLAAGAAVRLEWIVSGVEHEPTAINGELLGRIQQAIARVYREEGVALDELELGRIGADELNAVGEVSPDEWHVVARLIAEQHRHRLRTESMASRRAVSGSYKDGA